ncbi:actin-like ATPase domain-containing protein [Ramaria rubella]|nr:actin-like ATPase domain-containing protein [Ramaria rubella]
MPSKTPPAGKPTHFLGLELSTEQLRAVVVDEQLDLVAVEAIDFDTDLSEYQTHGGVFTTPGDAYTTPVDMWVKALDLLLQKLRTRVDLNKVKSITGAAQNATVWWTSESSVQLAALSPQQSLHAQLGTAKTFALLHTPSAHDASTATQAQAIEAAIGGPDIMAHRVGTAAHAALTAAQAMKVREGNPEAWTRTARGGRLALASAFIPTLFLGRWSPLGRPEVAGTGMWNAQLSQWDELALEIVAGSKDGGRILKDMLGHVELDAGRKLGNIASYFVERYGFDPETFITPFTSDHLATYLSLCPTSSDSIISFGSSDVFLTAASHYLPTRLYSLFPHPAQDPSETPRYVTMLYSRNADVPRSLVRDMYTKSWSAFDRLIAIVPPGGSIGLDDKLFSFWVLQGEAFPFSHVKGIYRFESGIKVNEFRDLRANPRCLLESQLLSFRARFARMVAQTGLLYPARPTSTPTSTPRSQRASSLPFSLGLSFDPYDSTHLPRRVFAVGAAAHFPSVVNLIGDVFDAPVFVPSTVLDAAQSAPAQSSPPPGIPSRAALGSAYLARWAWRRVVRPEERHTSFEDEVRWLLGKRWAAQQTQGNTPMTPGGMGASRFGAPVPKHLASASARSGLAATAFVEEDEEDVARFQITGEVPMSSVFKYPPEPQSDMVPRVRTLTGTSASSGTSNGTHSMGTPGAPSTAFTTPDLMAPSPNALSPNGTSSAALTPIAALQTDDADAQFGLVKVAEPDSDAFMAYAAMVAEYCRLEALIIKGLV